MDHRLLAEEMLRSGVLGGGGGFQMFTGRTRAHSMYTPRCTYVRLEAERSRTEAGTRSVCTGPAHASFREYNLRTPQNTFHEYRKSATQVQAEVLQPDSQHSPVTDYTNSILLIAILGMHQVIKQTVTKTERG